MARGQVAYYSSKLGVQYSTHPGCSESGESGQVSVNVTAAHQTLIELA